LGGVADGYAERRQEPAVTAPRGPFRPISLWWVIFGIAAVGLAVWASSWWLLTETAGLSGAAKATARMDAIKTGLGVGAGTGGAVALLLALRRQWLNERDQLHREEVADITHSHAERVASASEHDAVERRITDLYAKAADQLGNDKAPVRLAGLYALERLAQDNPAQRQTIVNVLCAYLRMPYAVTAGQEQIDGEQDGTEAEVGGLDVGTTPIAEREQERHVRLAAQRVLTGHLRRRNAPDVETLWSGMNLDLNGATLLDFDLSHCDVHDASFDGARFLGQASFMDTRFIESVSFRRAQFSDDASFLRVQVDELATFTNARFDRDADFDGAEFESYVDFNRAHFARDAKFDGARLGGRSSFMWARFGLGSFFRRVRFDGQTSFTESEFSDTAVFDEASFHSGADFARATFGGSAVFGDTVFAGEISFNGANFERNALFGGSIFDRRADFSNALFGKWADFSDARFAGEVAVYGARARVDVDKPDTKRCWPESWVFLAPKRPHQGHLGGRAGIWGELVDSTIFGEREQ
jgi:uncharacterized protein YjbI with pentapeptide repeats